MAHDGRWRRESGPDSSTVGAGSFLELEMAPLVLLTFLGGTNLLYWIALVIVTRPGIEYDLALHCNGGYSAGIKEDWLQSWFLGFACTKQLIANVMNNSGLPQRPIHVSTGKD